jgi:hypothetical protein
MHIVASYKIALLIRTPRGRTDERGWKKICAAGMLQWSATQPGVLRISAAQTKTVMNSSALLLILDKFEAVAYGNSVTFVTSRRD